MKIQQKIFHTLREEFSGYWWLEKDEYTYIQHALEKITESCEILPPKIKKKFFMS